MAPDRVLGKHPRFSAYLILFLSVVVFALTIWVYVLNGRVSEGESIRRVEDGAAAARAAQGLRFAQAIIDTSICIPLANIQDLLDGSTLTAMERADREQAKGRYLEKLAEFQALAPQLKGCG